MIKIVKNQKEVDFLEEYAETHYRGDELDYSIDIMNLFRVICIDKKKYAIEIAIRYMSDDGYQEFRAITITMPNMREYELSFCQRNFNINSYLYYMIYKEFPDLLPGVKTVLANKLDKIIMTYCKKNKITIKNN